MSASLQMSVAVFGGSFNPPHVGHVLACALVLGTHDVERVIVVPAYRHPFAKALAPYDDRLRMCELAMGWLPGVEISRIEQELGGDSLTLRTLEALARHHPGWRMRLVIGADILPDAPRWVGFDAIEKIAPPIVLGRAGVEGAGERALLPDVSSTEVRAAIARGAWDEIAATVPREVVAYARARGLYGSAA